MAFTSAASAILIQSSYSNSELSKRLIMGVSGDGETLQRTTRACWGTHGQIITWIHSNRLVIIVSTLAARHGFINFDDLKN